MTSEAGPDARPPRILHRIWVGPPIPERLASIGEQWQEMHPTWEHRLWGDDDLDWLVNRDLYDQAETLVPADAVGQFRADVARYEILLRYGGVYVDCDFEPLRPIDGLMGPTIWASWEKDGRWIANGILAGPARHPWLRRLVDGLPASVTANRGRRPHRMSGPHYVTRTAPPDLHVYPQRFFYPYAFDELDRHGEDPGEAYMRHLWWHQRTVRGKPC